MTWLVVWSSLLFALGLILGGRLGIWLEERHAARKRKARREERRAARWLAGVRETRGGTVMPHRQPDAPEIAHSWPSFSIPVTVGLMPEAYPARSLGGKIHDIHGGPGQDCWCGYVGADHADIYAQADDEPPPYAFPAWSLLNADPPTLGEEIQAMIANANAVPSVRWLDRLRES